MSDIKAATVLTDERIDEIARKEGDEDKYGFIFNKDGRFSVNSFARAIEAEVLAHAGVTAEPASHTQFEIDKAWNKAIEAEGKSARLRSENARLIAALKDIVENPTRCVTIADAAIIASADSAE